MRTWADRIVGAAIAALSCLVVLSCIPALAADNYDDVTTTLTGNWTNYGTVTTTGDDAMSSGAGETSTNAASGVLSTSGDSAEGITNTSGTVYNYGSITTTGTWAEGIIGTTDTVYNYGSVTTTGQHSDAISVSGTVYNYGSVTATGLHSRGIGIVSGVLYNSGAISVLDGTSAIISSQSDVHLLTGTRILSGDVFSVGNSNLYLDGSGIVDFDIGGGWTSFYKTGSGTWTFDRSFTGNIQDVRLQGGTLAVSPGVALTPGGYVQSAGTTLSLYVDGSAVPLAFTGVAVLNGNLEVDVSSASLGASHNVLTAGGGVFASFDSFSSSNPNFSVNVAYGANAVSVTSAFTPQWDASSMALSSTLAAAQGFSSVASARSLTMLAQADQSDGSQDREILVASAGSLDGLLAPRDEEPRWGLYLQPMYATGSRDAGSSIGYDWNTAGFEAGLDYRLAPDLLLGVMGGYGSTKLEFTGSSFVQNDTEDQDMATLGLYAGWAPGPWRVTDVLSVGRVEHESQRNAGLGQTAKADYDSWVWANRAQVVYVWVPAEDWEIAPRVGLDTIHVSRGGFEEYGAANAVRYDDFDQTFWEGSLGLRASYGFDLADAVLTPYAGLGYSRNLGDNDVTVRQYLSTASARVTTENDDDRLTTELGLTLARLPLELTVGYTGEYSDNTESHGLSATLRWEF